MKAQFKRNIKKKKNTHKHSFIRLWYFFLFILIWKKQNDRWTVNKHKMVLICSMFSHRESMAPIEYARCLVFSVHCSAVKYSFFVTFLFTEKFCMQVINDWAAQWPTKFNITINNFECYLCSLVLIAIATNWKYWSVKYLARRISLKPKESFKLLVF